MKNNSSFPGNLVIREFNIDTDYDRCIHLWENAGPGIHVRRSDKKDELAKKLQRDADLFLVAEAGGQMVGTVMGGFDGRRGMVYHLAVEKSYRNKGLGATLMTELEKRMKEKGCIRSYLLVTRDNLDAIRFYQSHGWEQMDILTFGKDLE